ncbi:hypothetical protein E4T56_gene5987, partial [Termitomyces sp. T112]
MERDRDPRQGVNRNAKQVADHRGMGGDFHPAPPAETYFAAGAGDHRPLGINQRHREMVDGQRRRAVMIVQHQTQPAALPASPRPNCAPRWRAAAWRSTVPPEPPPASFARLGRLYGIGVSGAFEIRAENDPFAIRCEGHVGFGLVIVGMHIDQLFLIESPRHDQLIRIRRGDFRIIADHARGKQVQPFAIGCMGHHLAVSAIAGKQFEVRRLVIMHRPLVAFQMIPCALARPHIIARKPEDLPPRRLQIVPDRLAIGRKELMARDLIVHGPRVDQFLARAVGADGPDAVHLVPGPFVAIHDQARIGRRELHMVEPVIAGHDGLALAGDDLVGKDLHRITRMQAAVQRAGFRIGIGIGRAIGAVLGIGVAARNRIIALIRADQRAVGVHLGRRQGILAQQQRFIGIDRSDRAARHIGHFPGLAGIDIDGIDLQRPDRIVPRAGGVIGVAADMP